MPLLPPFLWHVDDVAEVQRELCVGGAVFDTLVALGKKQIFKKM